MAQKTPTWEERLQTLTHILTHPTSSASLHSQLFVASRVPCFLDWDYPPFLCSSGPHPNLLLRWSLRLFLRRAAGLGFPATSWRAKCPFLQPPPVILSAAVEPAPARWGTEERRAYARRRLRRGQLGLKVPPLVAVTVPNLCLLLLLFWDPLGLRRRPQGE